MSEEKPMTVGELIEKLKEFPHDIPVRVWAPLPDDPGAYPDYEWDNRDIESIGRFPIPWSKSDYVRIEIA